MLSQGYSMLYQDATALGRGELILYAKIESDGISTRRSPPWRNLAPN